MCGTCKLVACTNRVLLVQEWLETSRSYLKFRDHRALYFGPNLLKLYSYPRLTVVVFIMERIKGL